MFLDLVYGGWFGCVGAGGLVGGCLLLNLGFVVMIAVSVW